MAYNRKIDLKIIFLADRKHVAIQDKSRLKIEDRKNIS